MKIGILTLPFNYNYGGILQGYALQEVLRRMGHDPVHINKPFRRTEPSNIAIAKRLVKKALGMYKGYIFYEKKYNSWLPQMMSETNTFISKHIKLTVPTETYLDLTPADYNALIVGSDQVWRPKMFQYPIELAYLVFAKDWNVKRLSYAASFGTDDWEYNEEETNQCKNLIKLFDAVSVREEGGATLCHNHFGRDATVVCDPTLLLTDQDYISLIESSNVPKSDGSLFNYILDRNEAKARLVLDIAKDKNLIPFEVNSNDGNVKCNMSYRIAKPVESWLRAFYDAEFILTDSYHACVFSIIFHKPFAVVVNNNRGASRFESLLGMLHLKGRIIESFDDYKHLSTDIDYSEVDKRLQKVKGVSLNYLNISL